MISEEEECIDVTYKVVLVGESCVGKTSLMKRLMSDQFHAGEFTTVGECRSGECWRRACSGQVSLNTRHLSHGTHHLLCINTPLKHMQF